MKESQGVEQLSEHKTVRWENLPDLPLYMDQVVTYLERGWNFSKASSRKSSLPPP